MTKDAHAAPSGEEREPPLYDLDIPTPTHAERARTLAALLPTGTLCTMSKQPAGFPYGSFVTTTLAGGDAVFLISELAEHTRNLRADSRCSLLLSEPGEGDPLARGRVTLVGHCVEVAKDESADVRAAYLRAHPNAEYYVDYKDFAFWRLRPEAIRYIGGYGRMSWVEAGDWAQAQPDPIAPFAAGIVKHMNDDHAESLLECAHALSRATEASAAEMLEIDRYGMEVSVDTPKGKRPVRFAFDQPASTRDEARERVIALVQKARASSQ